MMKKFLSLLTLVPFLASAQVNQVSGGARENKYVVCKSPAEMRSLKIPDTSYVFHLISGSTVGDYRYDPTDATTTDDTVMTIVSAQGQRYKRYIPDGVYDPKWFGAKANGSFNDTRAVEDCIRAITKYSNNKGGRIRLWGNYRFDAINFTNLYPTGLLTFEIDGNVTLLNNHTWTLKGYKNIVGKAAGEGGQFSYGTTASITGYFTNTDAPALRVIQGHNYISDVVVFSHNIGILFDGTVAGWIPTSNIDIERVSVCIINSDKTLVSGILNKDCFWINFNDCSVTTSGGRDSSASIRLINTVNNGFAGHTYLINFKNLVTMGWPVRIIGGVDAGNAFNINFHHWVAEVPKECILFLDSRKGSIRYINLFEVGGADGAAPLIKNVGKNTSAITIEKCNIPSGYYIEGDQVKNVSVNYMSFDPQTTNHYVQEEPDFLETGNSGGGTIGLNVQRGWKEGIHAQLGYPLTFPSSDAAFISEMSLDGTTVTGGYKNFDGSSTAFLVKNDYKTPKTANFNRNITLKSGDKIIVGVWVKTEMDANCDIYMVLPSYPSQSHIKWRESNGKNYGRVEPFHLRSPRFDWTFMTFYGTIDSANNETVNVALGIRFPTQGKIFFSRPYFYHIKASDAVGDRQAIEFARELVNVIPNAPVGSRVMPLRTNLYIGKDDSTIFNINTKKWYQNTQINYISADSNALVTKKYVDETVANSGSYKEMPVSRGTKSVTSDVNYTSSSDNVIFLEVQITGNKTLTLPKPSAVLKGAEIKIWNQNKTANSWQFSGNVVDAASQPIKNLTNNTWYILICNGAVWSRVN